MENGYHITKIQKGVLGQPSKIFEETSEFMDAVLQGNDVMAILELSDLYGAIETYLENNHPTISFEHLRIMSDATKRAFKNGHRT